MYLKHLALGVLRDGEPETGGGGQSAPPPAAAETPPPAQLTPETAKIGTPETQTRREMLRSLRPDAQPVNGAPQPPAQPPAQAAPQQPAAEAQPEPSSVDLDDIDFDEVDFDEPDKPEAKAEPEKPAEADEASPGEQVRRDRNMVATIQETLGLSDEQVAKLTDSKTLHKLETALLSGSRGQRMRTAFKAIQDLEKNPDEGGVGYTPTPEELRDGFKLSRGYQMLVEDINNLPDNPARLPDVLGFMFGAQGQPVESAPMMARALPGYLVQHSPEAFQQLRGTMLGGLIGEAEHAAQRETDAGKRTFYGQLANALRYWVDPAQYRPAQTNGQAPQSQPNLDDHPELQRLRGENEQMRRQMTQAQQAQFERVRHGFEADKRETVAAMFRKPFEKVDIDPRILNPILDQKAGEALQAINQNPVLQEHLEGLLTRALRRNDQQAYQQAIGLVRRAAEAPVRRMGPEIKETLKLVYRSSRGDEVAKANEQHAKFQNGQQQLRQPGSSGAPAPGNQSVIQEYDPSSGQSLSQWRRQQMAAARM